MTQGIMNNPIPSAAKPQVSRRIVFSHALAFVLGFSVIFTFLFGPAAVLLGQGLNIYFSALQKLGAVLLLIFALVTLGVFRWLIQMISERSDLQANPVTRGLVAILSFFNTLLYTERRMLEMHKIKRGWGYVSSVLLGMSFSAGWVPCIGPILASILFLASGSTTVGQGSFLLAIYSLGLGLPFLMTGLAFGRATNVLQRLNRHANGVSVVSGIFLLLVAWLLWNDQLQRLTVMFSFLNEWILVLEEGVSANLGVVNALDPNLVSAMPLAFVAGLISFISPCVLPLVPAYIGYLSGVSLGSNAR
jgi:cytochrome c-type biogenesis protein